MMRQAAACSNAHQLHIGSLGPFFASSVYVVQMREYSTNHMGWVSLGSHISGSHGVGLIFLIFQVHIGWVSRKIASLQLLCR